LNGQNNDAREINRAFQWLSEYYDKPIHPKYHSVTTLVDAISLLERFGDEAKVFAGGTDLIGLMKNRVHTPGVLVNIKPIRKMQHVVLDSGWLSIGALTLIGEIGRSPLIRQQYPILFEASGSVASPHIRNMATIAGNLCQESRCSYYRRPPDTGLSFNCRRKSEKGVCYALNSENQYLGVTGSAPCVSVCPSDLATVLLAVDGRIKIEGNKGGRLISVGDLYTTLGTTLKPAEIITSIRIPKIEPESKQRFLKFRRRKAIDFAVASVAVVIQKGPNNTVREARIALGGLSHKPLRARKAEQILLGERLTEKSAREASRAAVLGLNRLSMNAYKVKIVEALVRRAIME
jgi:xanthine dehydrogenase YagS FAD-binding subunit